MMDFKEKIMEGKEEMFKVELGDMYMQMGVVLNIIFFVGEFIYIYEFNI